MQPTKRALCYAVLIFSIPLLLIPSWCLAQIASFEFTMNNNEVEGKLDGRFLLPRNNDLYVGARILESNDVDNFEYKFYDLNVSLHRQIFSPMLTAGVGAKYIFGDMDIVKTDYDIAAMSLFLTASYDLRKSFYYVPLSLSLEASLAPKALNYKDSEEYYDYGAALYFHINYYIALVGKVRRISNHFGKNNIEAKLEDDVGLIGVRIFY